MTPQLSKSSPSRWRLRQRELGFSMIELIGVLAVLAILASILVPSLIERMKSAAAENETANLQLIVEGLERHVLRNRQIPDESNWSQSVAIELGKQHDSILETAQQTTRVYLIDPDFRIGIAGGTLPYTQTTGGSIEPVSPRLMILSSLDATKALPVSSGVIDAIEFANIWETAEDDVPVGWGGRWIDSGEDLKIRRINLASMFKRLILNNFNSPVDGWYSIDAGAQSMVPPTGINAFFIEGTAVNLFDSNGDLESRQILRRPSTFVYDRSLWRGQLFQGLELPGDDTYSATTLFLNAAPNPDALSGATGSAVVDAMTAYFNSYVNWDLQNFPATGSPSYTALEAARATLDVTTADLIYKPAPPP